MLPLDNDAICSIVLSPWSLCSTLSLLSHLRVGRAMIRVPSCFVIILHQVECSMLFTVTNMCIVYYYGWCLDHPARCCLLRLLYLVSVVSWFTIDCVFTFHAMVCTLYDNDIINAIQFKYYYCHWTVLYTDSILTSAGTKMLQRRSRSIGDEHRL